VFVAATSASCIRQGNALKTEKKMKRTISTFVLLLTLNSFGQTNKENELLGRKYAEEEIEIALRNKKEHNVVDNKNLIIKDSLTATEVAEPILFSIYGKEHIEEQKPYKIYLINNYWVIYGVLPEGYVGGNFLIIIDGRNSKVIRITHGK
jgi:hypothetical protein